MRSRVLRDVAWGPSVETGAGVPGYSGGVAACVVGSYLDLQVTGCEEAVSDPCFEGCGLGLLGRWGLGTMGYDQATLCGWCSCGGCWAGGVGGDFIVMAGSVDVFPSGVWGG